MRPVRPGSPVLTEVLQRGALYPLANRWLGHNLVGRWTGERRRINPGEWYLSGASVEAYQYPSTATAPTLTAYHVAEILEATITTRYHVTGLKSITGESNGNA
jgi:hypothetical protein